MKILQPVKAVEADNDEDVKVHQTVETVEAEDVDETDAEDDEAVEDVADSDIMKALL